MAGPDTTAHQDGSVALTEDILLKGEQPIVLLWPLELVLAYSLHLGQVNVRVTSLVLVDVDLRKKSLSFVHSSDEISNFKNLRLSLHLIISLLPGLAVHAILACLTILALFTRILTLLAVFTLLQGSI